MKQENDGLGIEMGYKLISVYATYKEKMHEEGVSGENEEEEFDVESEELFDSIKDMVSYIQEHVIYADNVKCNAFGKNTLVIKYVSDKEGASLDDESVELWKNGVIEDQLFDTNVTITFCKVIKSDVSTEEMEREGFKEY